MIWGQAMKNMGQLASHLGKKALSTPTGVGAGVGAMYGAFSDNTSVLGGMVGGAAVGRYGTAALKQGLFSAGFAATARGGGVARRLGFGTAGMGIGVLRQMSQDFRGARILANQGINKIRGLGR